MNAVSVQTKGRTKWFFLEPSGDIVQKTTEREKQKICTDISSFDILCPSEDTIEIFATTHKGSLVNISIKGENINYRTIMETKDADRKICFVRCLLIEGRYHLFYCLANRLYLIHQVVTGEEIFEPKVIDTVSKRFAYDVTLDSSNDIYIVYSTEGEIRYRKYIYSQKSISSSNLMCVGNPRKLQCALLRDNLYVAYSEHSGGALALNIVASGGVSVKKGIFSLDKESQFSLNATEENLVLHIAENGVCYEMTTDLSLNVSRPVSVGKTLGIWQIRFFEEIYTVHAYPVNRFMLPFESVRRFEALDTKPAKEFVPIGYEAESFAHKYRDVFEQKVIELEKENIETDFMYEKDGVKGLWLVVVKVGAE